MSLAVNAKKTPFKWKVVNPESRSFSTRLIKHWRRQSELLSNSVKKHAIPSMTLLSNVWEPNISIGMNYHSLSISRIFLRTLSFPGAGHRKYRVLAMPTIYRCPVSFFSPQALFNFRSSSFFKFGSVSMALLWISNNSIQSPFLSLEMLPCKQ